MNLTNIHEDTGSIPVLALWIKRSSIAVSCGVGCRYSLDPALLWLWCRPAAVAPTQPLVWELPYAMGAALKKKKKKKTKKYHIGPHGFVSLHTLALVSRAVSTLRNRISHMPTCYSCSTYSPSPPSLSPSAEVPHRAVAIYIIALCFSAQTWFTLSRSLHKITDSLQILGTFSLLLPVLPCSIAHTSADKIQ